MEYARIKDFADSLLDDEAISMAEILELRKPEALDPFAERARGKPSCPNCGETVRSCGGGPAEGSKKEAMVRIKAISCELHRLTLKEPAEKCGSRSRRLST